MGKKADLGANSLIVLVAVFTICCLTRLFNPSLKKFTRVVLLILFVLYSGYLYKSGVRTPEEAVNRLKDAVLHPKKASKEVTDRVNERFFQGEMAQNFKGYAKNVEVPTAEQFRKKVEAGAKIIVDKTIELIQPKESEDYEN